MTPVEECKVKLDLARNIYNAWIDSWKGTMIHEQGKWFINSMKDTIDILKSKYIKLLEDGQKV